MHNLLKDKKSIMAWLDRYGVERYTLVSDAQYGYVVDVEDHVRLGDRGLITLDVKFNVVSRSFFCDSNSLTSLMGSPLSVGETFFCHNNKLKSLEYAPEFVGWSFICSLNRLTSLEHCPSSVPTNFYCDDNKLVTLEGAPSSVGHDFNCSSNKLKTLDFLPEFVGGWFDCSENKNLGPYQKIRDIAELKMKLKSDTEQKLLSDGITTVVIPKKYKI